MIDSQGEIVSEKHWSQKERAIVARAKLIEAKALISSVDDYHGSLLPDDIWKMMSETRDALHGFIWYYEQMLKGKEY